MFRISRAISCLVALCATSLALADLPAEGDFLRDYAETYRFRLGKPTRIVPTPDGRHVLFLRSGARDFERRLYELDVATGAERQVLCAADLLGGERERLADEERARRERMRLVARGIASYQLSQDGRLLLIPLSGRLFVHDRARGTSRELVSSAGPALDARLSPDGRRVACVRGREVFVIDVESGDERQLTDGASDGITHGLAEFVAQEEMRRYHGLWWSPDSGTIVYQRTDTTGLELLSIADGMHPERAPTSAPYPRPGMRNADVRLGLLAADGGDTIWIEWDRDAFEYLASVRWERKGPLTLLVREGRLRCDINRHHLVPVAVEELFSAARPGCLLTPFRGDQPLGAGAGKRLHVNLLPAGFIGPIGYPMTVRGEHHPGFTRGCLEERPGCALTLQRKHPDVRTGGWVQLAEGQELSVGRPRMRGVAKSAFQKSLRSPSSIRRFPEHILRSKPGRYKDDPFSIRCPERKIPVFEGQLSPRIAADIINRDITALVIRLNGNNNLLAVW